MFYHYYYIIVIFNRIHACIIYMYTWITRDVAVSMGIPPCPNSGTLLKLQLMQGRH